jgi:ATP-dependent protease HslVU (ClpYQ) peptidase subunit
MDWNEIFKVWLEFVPFIGIYIVVSQLQHGKVMEGFKTVGAKFDAVNAKFDAKFDTANANLTSAVAQLEKAIADATLVHIRAEHGIHVSNVGAPD